MRDFYSSLPECERQRISRLENFDEYEEYHLKCDHYVLVLARPDDTYAEIEKLVSDTKGYKGIDEVDHKGYLDIGYGCKEFVLIHIFKHNSRVEFNLDGFYSI